MQHLAFDYRVVKSTICDAIHWVEGVLIKQKEFHLPGKKALLDSNQEIVLIDATEHEIERPKKNKDSGILVRKRTYHQNTNNSKCKNTENYRYSTI